MTDSDPPFHQSARALLDRETLTEADLKPIFENVALPQTAADS